MDENKSFIMMVILISIFILMMWFMPVKSPLYKSEEIKPTININKEEDKTKAFFSNVKDFNESYEIIFPKENQVDEEIIYENKNLKIIFSKHDAIIKHAYLKYNFSGKEEQIDLVHPVQENDGALRIKFGKWDNDLTLEKLTGGTNYYSYNLENKDRYIFECKIKEKKSGKIYTIKKIYQFYENEYYFDLEIEIFNDKNEPIKFDKNENVFSIGWGPFFGINSRNQEENRALIDTFSFFNGTELKDIKLEKNNLLYTEIERKSSKNWISINTHYFAVVLYPKDKNISFFADSRDYKNKNYYCGFTRSSDEKIINSQTRVYLLPKSPRILSKYEEFKKDGIIIKSLLEKPIMFGLGNIIERILYTINKVVKNYGISIIILTILIKFLLHPLTLQSMKSQKKLASLQPKIKELQEKYKDNAEVLNREIMKLYQKEKINPFSGCLPLLFQMPLLIAMYRVLSTMVELKGANFLWIRDLTLPDAIYFFPFTINLILVRINSINILPIIMVVTQILSTVIMPEYRSNNQTKMMIWLMPLLFFILFYNISAGLVLYWTVMNILNIIHQIVNNLKPKKLNPVLT